MNGPAGQSMIPPFEPGWPFRSGHLQTVLGSRGRQHWIRKRARKVLESARQEILEVNDGVRLEAWLSSQPEPAPTIILIHGWLGHADSSYLLSAAASLWDAGFSVFRLNLRDHGDTAHLNEALFHSARIDEVVHAIDRLARVHARGPVGLAGFSLGGNFALRVARALPIDTVAICPAIDPPATMARIDSGPAIYRQFFVRKWHRSLAAKQRAHPTRYRFEHVRRLKTVGALTDLFVRDHTDFASTDDYFQAYSLTGAVLAETQATILYARDDPVIPAAGFEALPSSLNLIESRYGGHCAFVAQLAAPTWSDEYLVRHFSERL